MTSQVDPCAVYGPSNPNKPPRPCKHEWFDPWLIAKGEPLIALVRDVTDWVHRSENRKRARRPEDQRNHLRAIEGTVCNLARAVLFPPRTGWLATSTRNADRGKGRYDNPAFGSTFRDLLAFLRDGGYLHRQLPDAIRGEVGAIAPTSQFADVILSAGIAATHFAADPAQEVIMLTRSKRPRSSTTGPNKKDQIDYNDTAQTRAYRAEVRAINSFLADADISFTPDGLDPPVPTYQRTMLRRFTVHGGEEPLFDQSGRLFGGFWQPLKRERRSGIRINGEPISDLDYQSMFQRLAYVELGHTPPAGDLYLIPALEGHREGIKLAMNCFLFDRRPNRSKWPKEMGMDSGDSVDGEPVLPKLPQGFTVRKTKKAILAKHPILEKAWGVSLGWRLMWQESQILLRVLTELMNLGVPALGMHDGLMVPKSQTAIALNTMLACSKAVVGIELPCIVKE